MSRIRVKLTKVFKRNGLALTKDAIEGLIVYLEAEGSWDEKHAKTEDLIVRLKENGLGSGKVTAEMLQPVFQMVDEGLEGDDFTVEEPFKIIDAFAQPVFKYMTVAKQFRPMPIGSRVGGAKGKYNAFRERYNVLLQRVLRHDNIRHTSEGSDGMRMNDKSYVVTTTQSLVGETGRKCVFGILAEREEGKIHLEDLDGFIEVDITHASLDRDTGFYTYNSFVLAEGEMDEGVFKVMVLAFPPYEVRNKSLNIFPNLDFLQQSAKKDLVLESEKTQEDTSFVFASEIYLDEPVVVERLQKMFDGYSQLDPPPSVFVLMGNWTKERLGTDASDMPKLRKYFDMLCDMICKHKSLVENCRWIFVAGPRDPSVGNILPRRGLLNVVTKKLLSKLNAEFPSNPFRIQYFTQELVVLRENLQGKLRRNTVLPCEVNETDDLSNHMIKTILCQAHLSPLPLIAQPIHWNFDHALRLYPAPTSIILGDMHEWYKYSYEDDCSVVNPGTFSSDGSFVVYYPATREFDYSQIK